MLKKIIISHKWKFIRLDVLFDVVMIILIQKAKVYSDDRNAKKYEEEGSWFCWIQIDVSVNMLESLDGSWWVMNNVFHLPRAIIKRK